MPKTGSQAKAKRRARPDWGGGRNVERPVHAIANRRQRHAARKTLRRELARPEARRPE